LESDTFYTLKITAENECCLGQESKRMEIKTLKVKGMTFVIQLFVETLSRSC
jgi:hypothetical protein